MGVDLGLKAAAVIHDGISVRAVDPLMALRTNLAKLRRLDRRVARKQKSSRNREKAKLRRSRLHYKVSCQRQAYLHQLSSSLAKTKSVIVLEDLHVKGMQRNRSLALSISDAGMAELRRQLVYKCNWYGSTLITAERFYPSSKLCSSCGMVKDTLGLGERVYTCETCGLSLDRDENAAINLRAYGLKELGIVPLPEGLREETPVERKALAPVLGGVKPASRKQEAIGRGTRSGTRRSTEKLVEVKV